MEEIRSYIEDLERTKLNLKKSKNKSYTQSYIDSKLERFAFITKSINEEIKSIEEENKQDEEELIKYNEQIKTKVANFLKELTATVSNLTVKQYKEGNPKIASFDLSLVGKSLQIFQGTFKSLDDFLTQVELLHDLTTDEDKPLSMSIISNSQPKCGVC